MTWTRACFRFVGKTLDPGKVDAELKLPGAVIFRTGDRPGPPRPSSWVLNSSLDTSESLEQHICGLIELLSPLEAEVVQLSEEFGNPSFFCTVASDDGEDSTYVANLHSDTLQAIARLKAHLFLSLSR